MRSTASARGVRRLSMVSWMISGFVTKVVVRKEVAHACDIAPLDLGLCGRQLQTDSLHRFADLQESHRDGVNDDLNGDRAMLEVGADRRDGCGDVFESIGVGAATVAASPSRRVSARAP